ncbi:MAG: AAA family ATPase [Candidatus Saccharimonas sp.]
MKHRDTLTVVIGPSGAGKSTAITELVRRTNAERIRTETTRPRRDANDDDTHIFVSDTEFHTKVENGYYLGHGEMSGYSYGLPLLPDTDTPKIVPLRAPFIPEVLKYRPDAHIVQFEASVSTLVARLEERGDHDRANPEKLALEIAIGRKFTNYIVSTDMPFEQSYALFQQYWQQFRQ